MLRQLISKFLYTLAVLWGVATLVFVLFNLLPADPAQMMLDQREDPELLRAIRAKYGLDKPAATQYFLFLNDLSPISWHSQNEGDFTYPHQGKYSGTKLFPAFSGDMYLKAPYLRESFQRQGRGVSSIIAETLPNTLVLAVSAMLIAVVFGIGLGIVAALKPNSPTDRFLTVFGTMGMSLPSFFSAILIAWIFGFVLSHITGLNMTGNLWELDDYGEKITLQWKNLILPAITLGIRPLGVIIQLTRGSLLETLGSDHIRTARAKGLSRGKIIRRHALKNSLNPVVTAVSGWFASMLAGAVFVEYIFGWNGLGKQIVEALNQLDIPLVTGAVLAIAFLFVLINFLTDILYTLLDPRVKSL